MVPASPVSAAWMIAGLHGLFVAPGLQGFLAAHGLQGLFAAHGLQGFAGFVAAHGLQGFTILVAAQGLHGFAAFAAAQGLHGFAALVAAHGLQGLAGLVAAQGLHAALPATGFFAAQGFSLCADRSDELPAASTMPMPTMSGRNVVDSSRLLSASMTDRLLVFGLRTSENTMGST
jgi:hypothetical protein